jgi:hypothetical protein
MQYKWDLGGIPSVGCTGDRKLNIGSLTGDSDSEVLSKTYALHIWLLAVEIHLTDALLLTGTLTGFSMYVCHLFIIKLHTIPLPFYNLSL